MVIVDRLGSFYQQTRDRTVLFYLREPFTQMLFPFLQLNSGGRFYEKGSYYYGQRQ